MNFFGTDGIRGSFGSTLTTGTAFLLGKSLALSGECPIVVVARDTRDSGEALYSALSDGVYDGGGNVINLGILPTNAVAHFTRKLGGDYGVMITASHNPPNDNGLKVFDRYGVKLCASKQRVLSKAMSSLAVSDVCGVTEPVFYDIHNIYCEDVLRAISVDLSGVNVALDCCYGATYRVAPLVFGKAGANVTAFCAKPNGKKINVNCGATVPDFLCAAMPKHFDVGFSFDGDGDRLAVVQDGRVVPNSKVFYALAKHFKQTGALRHNAVVGTTLTNGGVEAALNDIGIKLLRSDVGDVNVFNLMASEGLTFGGEESGHYLLCDYATSSDAIINALAVCEVIRDNGSLWAFTEECAEVPSQLKSFPVADASSAPTERALAATVARVTQQYPSCRVVLRKSGTENKLRAYVEGEQCNDAMAALAATLHDNA